MLNFIHIKEEKCPICGSGIRRVSIDGTHCSGGQFEAATYRCGYSVRYAPNFSRLEISTESALTRHRPKKILRTFLI